MIKINLPEQYIGEQADNSDFVIYDSLSLSKKKYKEIKQKLLDINNWNTTADGLSASFILTDSKGQDKSSLPLNEDLIKINIPVPGPIIGDGFDWVKIDIIEESFNNTEDYEYIYLRLKPTQNPNDQSNLTAHFYTNESSNNFILLREKEKITISIHGRNEVPNKSQSEGIDKIRNQGLAIGAIFGLANPQWKNLIAGLFKED